MNPSNAVFFFAPSGGILHASSCDTDEPTTDPSEPPNENAGVFVFVVMLATAEAEKGL